MRLAARLTGWDVDILTPDEYNCSIEKLNDCVKGVEEADDFVVDKLIALGIISVADLEDVGVEPLVKELKINVTLAKRLTEAAKNFGKKMAAEKKQSQAENLLRQQASETDSNVKE